jgi:hypothetical protein
MLNVKRKTFIHLQEDLNEKQALSVRVFNLLFQTFTGMSSACVQGNFPDSQSTNGHKT